MKKWKVKKWENLIERTVFFRQQKLKRSTWPWRFNLSGYLIISLDQKKFVSWSQSWYQKSVNIKKKTFLNLFSQFNHHKVFRRFVYKNWSGFKKVNSNEQTYIITNKSTVGIDVKLLKKSWFLVLSILWLIIDFVTATLQCQIYYNNMRKNMYGNIYKKNEMVFLFGSSFVK